MILSIFSFMAGLITGIYLYNNFTKFNEKLKRNQRILKINEEFKKVLHSIQTCTKFKSRYNSTVYLESNLEQHGPVEIIYMMDKRDIVILKDNLCLLTTESVDKNILDDITNTIDNKFNENINDVIEVMGCTLSREHFEQTFSEKIGELSTELDKLEQQLTETEKIISTNNQKFDIDEILDKISKEGINKLSTQERQFLDRYSNGKED